jgi:hypothetical protein
VRADGLAAAVLARRLLTAGFFAPAPRVGVRVPGFAVFLRLDAFRAAVLRAGFLADFRPRLREVFADLVPRRAALPLRAFAFAIGPPLSRLTLTVRP